MSRDFDAAAWAWSGDAPQLRAVPTEPGSTPAGLPIIDPVRWDGKDPPPREWAVRDWIPLRQATLLTGRGGVGKSLLTQQLSTCIALGIPFLGLEVQQMPSLYVSCEDDEDELWRRQAAICDALGISMRDLGGNLTLSSLAGRTGNALCSFDDEGKLVPSDRWRQIRDTVREAGIGFTAFDNASHGMVGDHNDLALVAAFLNMLNGLAIASNGAVLILHHPNKAGDDWLGSVAWENQVRSRLILKPSEEAGDRDARSLQNPKANYAPTGARLDFRWHKGAFVVEADLPPHMAAEIAKTAVAASDNEVFLRCLAERTRQRRAVSERSGKNLAPHVFAAMPEAKSVSKERLDAAMNRLFRLGKIERAELWRGEDRKPVYGLREVGGDSKKLAGNAAGNGAETRCGNAGNTFAETRATHTPSLREGACAAANGARPHGQAG